MLADNRGRVILIIEFAASDLAVAAWAAPPAWQASQSGGYQGINLASSLEAAL